MIESFFWDQTADCDNQRRNRRKIGAPKFGEIESVVNAVDAISAMREWLAQKARGVIRFGNDCACCIDKFIQSDFELPRSENVVRMRGKTETDWKKFPDPESGARSHTSEMSVHSVDPRFPQAKSNVNGLVEAKEIGAAPPFIQGG